MSETADQSMVAPAEAGAGQAKGRSHALGRELVSHFYMVAKTAGMFDFENVITKEAVGTFVETLDRFFVHYSRIHLQMASDCLFVNETRLKIDFEGFASFKYVIEAMKARGIGSIILSRGVTEDELKEFLALFVQIDHKVEDARTLIDDRLRAAGVERISLEEIRDLPEDHTAKNLDENHQEVAINTYFKSVFVAKQFLQNVRDIRTSYVRKARRLVHSIVDLVAQDDTTLLALTQIKNFDHFLFSHSANVCVHSVVLGQNLGLGKKLLATLGLAALMHDVGMTRIPKGIQARLETLSPQERSAYEQHPAIGARMILKSQGVSRAAIRCALVAFEHHVQQDSAGFPAVSPPRPLSLLGRIVAIADFYDTITTPDAHGDPHFTPEEALRLMAHEGAEVFDPLIVKVFVNTVGTYPLGTVVKLDTGETGIVHRRNPHFSQQARPLVKIIMDGLGMPVPPWIADLNEYDREKERFVRSITEVIPSAKFFDGIQDFTDLL